MRQRIRNPHAAAAVPCELERAAHQSAGGADVLDFSRYPLEIRLAVMLVEHWLGIEQIHLAGAAVHEEVDDGLGPAREMRRARLEILGRSLLCRGHAVSIAAQQIGQGGALNAAGDAREKTAAS